MLFALVALAACDDDGGAGPATPTAEASTAIVASPTPRTVRDLASQVGVRGDLQPNDPVGLAARYGKTDGLAARGKPFPGDPAIGSTRQFNVLVLTGAVLAGTAPPGSRTLTATLRATSEHAHFYIADSIDVSQSEIDLAAEIFDDSTWPAITSVFGQPPDPGVDGDPRIVVLQADLGGGVGGYHIGDDVFLRAVRPLSNEAEMVYMDNTLRAGGAAFNVVLAHELQHLIHTRNDDTEEAWANEGLSETASGLVGGSVSSVGAFAAKPHTQLTSWSATGSLPHYGAGAAFFRYIANRFGGDAALGAIARAASDGAAGVDEFLGSREDAVLFAEAFADWITANIVNAGEGRFSNGPHSVRAAIDFELAEGPSVDGSATQFGADYFRIALSAGEYAVRFRGSKDVSILPDSAGDEPVLWGNSGDSINTTLTREVDLSGVSDASLGFRTWYDIEPWFDWGYVAVSDDDGATWTALSGSQSDPDDPVSVAYGPGYTGRSGGAEEPAWVDEQIDLSAYAGEKISLRFEYVTDGSTHGDGWAIDDIVIAGEAISLEDDGWRREGWVHLNDMLPQAWIVRLIAEDAAGQPVVRDLTVSAGVGELRFSADGLTGGVIAVAGATEGTTRESPYSLELARP